MSRIDFGVALLAATALACVVLGPASARTPAPAKYGGTLVEGLTNGEPTSLDPTVNASASLIPIDRAMCQTLFDRDAKQQLVPVLAAALPAISKDKLSYTVQLRKGALFNDGTPLDAQAVADTVQRFMNYPGSMRANDYMNVESVSASGPYTVLFHLKVRDSTFMTGGQYYVLSPTQLTKLGTNFGTNPVCVGPFMFDHRVVGDNITLIKSPYYYDQKDVYLDKIVFKPLSDATAAAAALRAGDVQAVDNVSTTDVTALRENSSLRVIQAPQLGWSGVLVNIGNKHGAGNLPYTNVGTPLASSAKLRQAFEEAIDRNTLNKVVFGGLYQPSCTMISPADGAWYDATKVPCMPYNPKDAKKLVAASGFPNPTVHLLVRNATDRLRLAQFVQAQEAAVGINVVIDSTDSVTELARRAGGSFDADVVSQTPGGADPNINFIRFATSSSGNNSGYTNPRLDLILANGVKATDVKARSTLYHVAQKIIQADRPVIVLYNTVTFAAYSATLTGIDLTYNGVLIVANARYK